MNKDIHYSVVFEDKVYSLSQTGAENLFHLERFLMENRDDDLFIPLTNGKVQKFYGIYRFDKNLTSLRKDVLSTRKNYSFIDLSFSKKIIIDDRYPVYEEYWSPKDFFIDDEGQKSTYAYYPEFVWGRVELVKMIQFCRFREALPELRDVLLNEKSRRMFNATLKSLYPFFGKGNDIFLRNTLIEILIKFAFLKRDKERLNQTILFIYGKCPHKDFLGVLNQIVEEYFFEEGLDCVGPGSLSTKYWRAVVQSVLRVASLIPDKGSLEIIQKLLFHPLKGIRVSARLSYDTWKRNFKIA